MKNIIIKNILLKIKKTLIIISTLSFLILSLPYILNIKYHSDIEDYFQKNEKSLTDYQYLKSNFGNENTLLLAIKLTETSSTLLNRDTLNSLSKLLVDIKNTPKVKEVSSILDATVTSFSNGEQRTLSLQQYLQSDNSEDISAIFSQISDNLRGSSFWLSSDLLNTVIEVNFIDTPGSQSPYKSLLHQISSDLQTSKIFQIRPWGPIAVKAALNEALIYDGVYLFPIILFSGIALLYLFIGSIKLILAGIITILISLTLTLELAGLMSIHINQTSVLAFGIVFIISLADVIHVLMCYQSQIRLGKKHDIHDAIKQKLLPLCLTTLTTCIGFLSLTLAGSPTFSIFGCIAATGVALALFVTLFLLPTIVEILSPKQKSKNQPSIQSNQDKKPLEILNALIANSPSWQQQKHHWPIMIVSLFAIFLCFGLFKNTFHNDSLTYFSKSTPIHQATTQFENAFNTHQGLAILLTLENQESIYSSGTVATIDKFHQWLNQQTWASIHTSYLSTLINIYRNLHDNDFRWQQLPKDPGQIVELFNLYEMASDKNSLSLLGIKQANIKTTSPNILISIGIPEILNRDVLIIQQKIEDWFQLNDPTIKVTVSGQAILFANVGWSLTSKMLMGAVLTMSIITLIIGLVFKNARLALLSIIPNALPALVCLGAVGWLSGKINFAIAGSISIALGIVVDDTIHILSDYQHLRKQGISPRQSIKTTLIETGPALLLTTLVLTTGFSILNFASFIPNQHTAQMITAMVSSAIIFDFLLLPYLLVRFDHKIFLAPSSAIPASSSTILNPIVKDT
ncbi:hypothetical protein A9Q81_07815 [Gammaproteobacteria bacterium 42_54_T18]|nr:hypothetical protein A9Q81_07815 [Gammaproteobacteria bacterium 42_54_T18]